MKSVQSLLIAVILLMPACRLHAQENKHAQALHTAFIESRYNKLPKSITAKWTPGKEDSTSVFWTALDGAGLVPKNKIHVVKLSNSSAAVGPLYLDGWRFEFRNVPDDPSLPLRHILNAYDKQSPHASSYYSYVAGDEQAVFPGISIAYGEEGETFPLGLDPIMNVRVIGFKDDDGFRSTYLLSWYSNEEEKSDSEHKYYAVNGIMYEFHCPKLKSTPQVKSFNPDDTYLDRVNTSLSVAQNMLFDIREKEPERAKALDTDTLDELVGYNYITMMQKLYDSPETLNLKTSYEALQAKVQRMLEMSRTANPTEMKAICHTLQKEVESYPFLLSGQQVLELKGMIDRMVKDMPEDLIRQATNTQLYIFRMRNQTAEIDSLNDIDQDYLNRNHWTLTHQPMEYTHKDGCRFTSLGEHYSADEQTGYIHVWSQDYSGSGGIRIENTLEKLRPGRYRVSAVVRAGKTTTGHSGMLVFAQAGDQTVRKEIPADGDAGGNVWFSALSRFSRKANAHEGVYGLDISKASAHGGQGYGWNRIYLDDITITDDISNRNLTYGVALDRNIVIEYGGGSNWFSACDFIVERIGD